jgi:hypothetical protein
MTLSSSRRHTVCRTYPPAMERTFGNLLGPLGETPTVWAECLIDDPVGDIAVLGCPDNQALSEEADAYEGLIIEASASLPIADVSGGPLWRMDGDKAVALPELMHQASMLSLDGHWFSCEALHYGGPLVVKNATQCIRGGMPGSPIHKTRARLLGWCARCQHR